MRNFKVAAAVAGVLGAAASHAAVTVEQANGAPHKFYVAGSSAAVAGFGAAIGADLCSAGSLSQFTSVPSTASTSTPDFRAYSCISAGGVGANGLTRPFGGDIVTIYYRAEGGSVVGVYPVKNNVQVNFLNLATACPAGSSGNVLCTVGGTSVANGPTDNFPSGVAKHAIELGISDLEPQVFSNGNGGKHAGGGSQDPIKGGQYQTVFTGPDHTTAELSSGGGFTQTRLFQQVFGIVVSNNLTGLSNIGSDAVAAILNGTVTDWSLVFDGTTGAPVTAASTKISVCQRDIGSGTRAASDIYFEQNGCNTVAPGPALKDLTGAADNNFSTVEELGCVNKGNAIGYVSVDNFSKAGVAPFTNVKVVQLDGVTPSNKLAAAGSYNYTFEAFANDNATAQAANAGAATFYAYLKPALQDVRSAPKSGQVNALAGLHGNSVSSAGLVNTAGIFVTAYDRGGNSCAPRGNKVVP